MLAKRVAEITGCGNHRGIIGAQRKRRDMHRELVLRQEGFAQRAVGRNAPRHQNLFRLVSPRGSQGLAAPARPPPRPGNWPPYPPPAAGGGSPSSSRTTRSTAVFNPLKEKFQVPSSRARGKLNACGLPFAEPSGWKDRPGKAAPAGGPPYQMPRRPRHPACCPGAGRSGGRSSGSARCARRKPAAPAAETAARAAGPDFRRDIPRRNKYALPGG